MSHQPERKEKDCLNCGTIVQGRYCHSCGQENIEPKETIWDLVHHFFEGLTHFDGKVFITLKDLLIKPGFLSKEYIRGKRVRYLHPIQMYLFTSAVFFLIFVYLFNATIPPKNESIITLTTQDRLNIARDIKEQLLTHPNDTSLQRKLDVVMDTSQPVKLNDIKDVIAPRIFIIYPQSKKYTSVQEYDSIQKKLPAPQRDGWLKQITIKKSIEVNNKYNSNLQEGIRQFGETFLHNLPYLLFISLPLFALILKFLYRKQKNFYYTDHAIFTLHHYIFSFLVLAFIFSFNTLDYWLHWHVFNMLAELLFLTWGVYLYLAMKNFYGQRWTTTLGKFLLLNFLGFIFLLLLLLIFLFFSIFQM